MNSSACKRIIRFICFSAFFLVFLFPLICEEDFLRKDSDKRLRLYSSGEENAAVFRKSGVVDFVIHGDEERFVQKRYDESGRVIAEKIWKTDGSGFILEEKSTYSYNTSSARYSKKQTYLLLDYKLIDFAYNKSGLVTAETAYSLDENKKKSEKPLYAYTWKYDDKNRIVEKTSRTNSGAKLKIVYTFTANSMPDEKQYLGDELIYEKKYKTTDSYEETVLFDDGMSVTSVFERGIKKSETVRNKGKIIRTKEF